MDGTRKKKKPTNADLKKELQRLSDANTMLMEHNQGLAVYGGQLDRAMRDVLAAALDALEDSALIITPTTRRSRKRFQEICKIVAPFAASISDEELLELVPESVREFFMPIILKERECETGEKLNERSSGGSQEGQGEVPAGEAGNDNDCQE